ncbi:FadR/GntR family transcriptional regulator [Amaricoccus solimangrovi]|uniref:FadR family transcriptional regulator n=1 Tax=Amaricoccus solimangrovi TaxID=2589815 RepID=A0A501WAI0_9RHOB|nr:FCD domain-containing protein [Amaricoccus solimangrovi]TPE46639.1 FadR family transcriptional regulator [Amaricoccus solimangrovi]
MREPIVQNGAATQREEIGLVERTISDIQALIRREGLKVGDALPSEGALSASLGVSRTVAREALRALATLRVLEIGNGRRARVSAANADALSVLMDHTVYTGQLSIQQVLDVRRTLELRTASLAALRRSDDQARAMLEVVDRMFTALEENPSDIMELDIHFHSLIARASGNALYAILIDSYAVITRQTWAIGWRARGNHENRLENIRCHERIAKAIMMQDSPRAEAAMSEHFDSAIAVLIRAGIT